MPIKGRRCYTTESALVFGFPIGEPL